MINQPQPLSGDDLDRLEFADVRRTTLLAGWTLSLLYLFCDMGLQAAAAAGVTLAQVAQAWLGRAVWLQVCIFLLCTPLVWLGLYLADLNIEAAGRRSWLYRLGNLAHSRGFLMIYLALLLASAVVAVQYEVTYSSFWLILGLLGTSCAIGLIEWNTDLESSLDASRTRLTLLLMRLPLIRRYVSSGGLSSQIQAATLREDGAATGSDGLVQPAAQGQPPTSKEDA